MTATKPNQGVLRWGTFLAALMVFGPLVAMVATRITPVPGAIHGTALVGDAPMMGVFTMVWCITIAGLIGVAGSRLVSVGQGLTCFGVALAWASFRLGRLPDLARAVDPGTLGTQLAIEGAIVGMAVLGAAIIIARRGWPDEPFSLRAMASLPSLAAGAVAAAVGLAAAWVIAQDDKPGQTIAAGIAAGAAGAALARTLVHGAPRSAVLLAIPIGAIACPVIGFALTPSPMESAVLGGTAHALARVMPTDWCAGMLIGIPFGLSWAGSTITKARAGAPAGPGPVRTAS
jgi:hypothetical protein